jgi:hypothetical protein
MSALCRRWHVRQAASCPASIDAPRAFGDEWWTFGAGYFEGKIVPTLGEGEGREQLPRLPDRPRAALLAAG